ncbi:arylamine N-acetyltransferase family protein [Streptomyces sp.]|uniref:arylamine N-acetyltransferase family protein n=1 Tax=Streptomyces sp. TaxID=1931 RepID=UPI002F415E7C
MDQSVLPKPPGSEPEWGIDQLDLDAYFSRIGYDGPHTATFETLRRIHRAHADSITWEIIDMALGRHVSLDLKSVQRKIVADGQGGCCLESNLLFAAALEQLGFPVVRHIARVRRGNNRVRTRSHAVLLAEVDGTLWMCDPGFGDETPLEPMRFEDGSTLTVGDWTWRLDQEGEDWVLRCEHADGWFDVYALRLERHHMVDFDMINHFSYADPNSVFVDRLVVQLGTGKERNVLKDNVLVTQYADGRTESAELTGDQIVRTLRETFNIRLRDEDAHALGERFGTPQPTD